MKTRKSIGEVVDITNLCEGVVWTTSDSAVASVTDGEIKLVGPGECVISALFDSSPLLTTKISVEVARCITMNDNEDEILIERGMNEKTINQYYTLASIYRNSEKITYNIEDKDILMLLSGGRMVGLKDGETMVEVLADGTKVGEILVVVRTCRTDYNPEEEIEAAKKEAESAPVEAPVPQPAKPVAPQNIAPAPQPEPAPAAQPTPQPEPAPQPAPAPVPQPSSIASGNGNDGGHDYVDLGLPSGTLWATMNVGANAPEETGSYFAWGETKVKSEITEQNARWQGVSSDDMQRLGMLSQDMTLTSDADAATVAWGSKWCMPTKEQIEELNTSCVSRWITVNGVSGREFRGPNGNSIFMPATGHQSDGTYISGTGEGGYFWASTADTDAGYAASINFDEDSISCFWRSRYDGRTVRPVVKK